MAGIIRDNDRTLFPIKNISSVLDIFKNQLENNPEPDLALLSIIVGAVENSLTCNRGTSSLELYQPMDSSSLPTLELHLADALYTKFHTLIKSSVEKNSKFATRELIKRVSDVIWNSLTRSYYKDRAHLQSLYSYLTGNKLDCFGVAFAVVAGCQVLGFRDVHLALSEDHAWVVFGEDGTQTAEVTWHGKGNEDKRGQSIGPGVELKSWLYVNNCPVICTRSMEVAALVSAINPSLNATNDAYEVALLQQELLWLLYDLGHLQKYPMALGNLGDLEEIAATVGRPPCALLFKEAIKSAKSYYKNHHVYPYTYQGGYFYRNKMYKEAFESWANAADVIKQYNYSRDDEEIYKEFLEIANDLIPYVIKVVSSGHNARSVLRDPECFAYLLRFYDGICQWEEGSATPVLHIGWAKALVNTISKFDSDVRTQVIIICKDPSEEFDSNLNNNNYEPVAPKRTDGLHPSIEALTQACGEKLLNPKYLLQGGGQPFVGTTTDMVTATTSKLNANQEKRQEKQEEEIKLTKKEEVTDGEKKPSVILYSQKMKGLKDLLLAEKLNTQAISLQLTAQSQVQVGKKGNRDFEGVRPKRHRRD